MKSKLLLCLALVLGGGCATTTQHSPVDDPLSLSIALLDSPSRSEIYVDLNTNCHFDVVITNHSLKPQNLLMQCSSWGWKTLSFELTDEKGNKFLIQRDPAAWTDNSPVYWVLKPGEYYVRDVCLAQIYQGHDSWFGFPEQLTHGGDLKVSMKAIFEITLEKDARGAPLWHGRVESQPVICRIRDIRLRNVSPSSSGE